MSGCSRQGTAGHKCYKEGHEKDQWGYDWEERRGDEKGAQYQVCWETGKKPLETGEWIEICSRVGWVARKPLESPRNLGYERLPGPNQDDLSQNVQQWRDEI